MSLAAALRLQVPTSAPRRIRIEKPEILTEAENNSPLGVFFKVLLFMACFFSLLSIVLSFLAYQF